MLRVTASHCMQHNLQLITIDYKNWTSCKLIVFQCLIVFFVSWFWKLFMTLWKREEDAHWKGGYGGEWQESHGRWKEQIVRTLRARTALLQLKDVPLRTRRALLLYKVNCDSALLVLNGTSLICNSALLALSWQNERVLQEIGVEREYWEHWEIGRRNGWDT